MGGGGSDRSSQLPRKQLKLKRRGPSEVFGPGSMTRQVREGKRTHTRSTQNAHAGVHPLVAQADPCPSLPWPPHTQSPAIRGRVAGGEAPEGPLGPAGC